MDKLFYPSSIVIYGLSAKAENIPRIISENLIRWGYKGRIFGLNPTTTDLHVNGIRLFQRLGDLPVVPDLAVTLVPAKFIPSIVEECGAAGVPYVAIPAAGFNELGGEGEELATRLKTCVERYGVRLVGPNGVTVANTANGMCLPFVPLYPPPKGGFSLISQSGGAGLMLWNFLSEENIGLAKFASIGNKLDLDELDFLRYFASDPETKVIGMYLESMARGRELCELAETIDKPIILLKANHTTAGRRAAQSHTAALSNDDALLDSAIERAGIIRIRNFKDFLPVTKAFLLPPMRGNRIMVMSPAGGFAVIMADLCEEMGFQFADPGEEFYREVAQYTNAGVIRFSNPLDLGDVYQPQAYAHVLFRAMHAEGVDAVVYVSQWPAMPPGDDVFHRMFRTDISKEVIGSIMSSGKPLGICLFGQAETMAKIKRNLSVPIFNTPEEMVRALRAQSDFHAKLERRRTVPAGQPLALPASTCDAIATLSGMIGEETLGIIAGCGLRVARSWLASTPEQARLLAEELDYPLVLKVVSPEAVHKSDVGGVLLGLRDGAEVEAGFLSVRRNLLAALPQARFEGVRLAEMAEEGYDLFVGGRRDPSFGPVLTFGYGGIYVEVFRDVQHVLCPTTAEEVRERLARLGTAPILRGLRGKPAGDIEAFVEAVVRVSALMAACPTLLELDINPLRVLPEGKGVIALDARMLIAGGV